MLMSRKFIVGLAAISLVSCNQPGGSSGVDASSLNLLTATIPGVGLSSPELRVKLTDAPKEELESVFVDVDRAEVLASHDGQKYRVQFAKNLGLVDLLTLQNGKLLDLVDVQLPGGAKIEQFRLILKDEGHYAIKTSGQICELRTPSAQRSGLKIIFSEKPVLSDNHVYTLVIDFDAKKSVVLLGNGDCLLKPVIKVKSLVQVPVDNGDDGSNGGDDGSVGGDDGSVGGDDGSTGGDDGSAGGDDGSAGGDDPCANYNPTRPDEVIDGCTVIINDGDSNSGGDGWDDSEVSTFDEVVL